MATEKEQQPRETHEAGREREVEPKPEHPKESHEGMPGYGQPPDEVREKRLPEQNW